MRGPAWTAAEDAIIRKHWREPDRDTAIRLAIHGFDRPVRGVEWRRHALRLFKPLEAVVGRDKQYVRMLWKAMLAEERAHLSD